MTDKEIVFSFIKDNSFYKNDKYTFIVLNFKQKDIHEDFFVSSDYYIEHNLNEWLKGRKWFTIGSETHLLGLRSMMVDGKVSNLVFLTKYFDGYEYVVEEIRVDKNGRVDLDDWRKFCDFTVDDFLDNIIESVK